MPYFTNLHALHVKAISYPSWN